MRKCIKCGENESETVLFRRGSNICTTCKDIIVRKWKKENKPLVNKYQRDLRAKKNEPLTCIRCEIPKKKKDFKGQCRICKECQQKDIDAVNERKLKKEKVKTEKEYKKRIYPVIEKKESYMVVKKASHPKVRHEIDYSRKNKKVSVDWDKRMEGYKLIIAKRYGL